MIELRTDERVETPKQLAARVGLKVRQVRHLIQTGQLEYVLIGGRFFIRYGAFGRFLEANKVLPCQDETRDRGCDGSRSANASTSYGPNEAAAASAALARRTAKRLKSLSPNSSDSASDEPGRVIHLRSS
jgi:hypothetical protein